jgi:hypothetical protein
VRLSEYDTELFDGFKVSRPVGGKLENFDSKKELKSGTIWFTSVVNATGIYRWPSATLVAER